MTCLNRVTITELPVWARILGTRLNARPRFVLKQLHDRVLVFCAPNRSQAVLARWAWRQGDFTTYPPCLIGPFKRLAAGFDQAL